MKQPKRKQVHLRLTIEEWARAAAFAEHAGLNIPNAIRMLVRQKIESAGARARERLERRTRTLVKRPIEQQTAALRVIGTWQGDAMVARREAFPTSVERTDINLKLSLEEWAAAVALATGLGCENVPAVLRELLRQGVEDAGGVARRRIEQRAEELVASKQAS